MSFELFNTLTAFGDLIRLTVWEDPDSILNNLKQFDNNWVKYNPRKDINRWGLSVTNLDGNLGPGPDLDSLYEYNKENNTNITESNFIVPTPVYDVVKLYCDPFKEWLFRSHILKLKPGGFFPSHVDNIGSTIDSFRLIVPLQVCDPKDKGYFIYEQNKILFWEYGNLHFFNTCKRHLIFNANDEYDHIVLIMNVELTKESVETVTNLIEQ